MNRTKWINTTILVLSLLTIGVSVTYMTRLSRKVADEEQQRIAIWAEATQRLIQAEDNEDIDFYSSIIAGNTSIPVYMVDSDGRVILTRNVTRPVDDPTQLHGPIEMEIQDGENRIVQYIYYDDSVLIWNLRYFPYMVFILIAVFVAIGIALILSQNKAEQNYVWVGLSKETAHQLGTPISSLNGWQALLESKYPEDSMLPEMRKDIERLHMIADRFSKVGSAPELREQDLGEQIEQTVRYMQTRVGRRTELTYRCEAERAMAAISAPLFSWVLENLIKNAVDAGATEIGVSLTEQDGAYCIDVADNGKGIAGNPSRIFQPGYTTKKRGWGLGLSLAKRIVEEYHHGRLFVLSTQVANDSQTETGTTLRIKIL